MANLANKYRPRKFAEVVGQKSEVEVLKTILTRGWKPNAMMVTGPFGTGKTTLGRLLARSLLCDNRQGIEPCGSCESCLAMDADNNVGYIELDAASNGGVADIKEMKDQLSYKLSGGKMLIVNYDESHMLSTAAQNALLKELEEGIPGVLFIFCTTDAQKMLPTIKSRCIELHMKLLSAAEITDRVITVAQLEGITIDPKAARILSTYVRGHVRDAMTLLEQVANIGDKTVNEDLVRSYLRLDKYDEIYQFLCLTDKKTAAEQLETLLCNYAGAELADTIGDALVNAYKLSLGIETFTQVDRAWLAKVNEARPGLVLQQADAILSVDLDFSTLSLGLTTFMRILFEEDSEPKTTVRGLRPMGGPATPVPLNAPGRKAGR